jgi:hypothetical protein
MRIVKAIFALFAFAGGALTVIGIVEFFTAGQTAIPLMAAITVSGVGTCLLAGIAWLLIDIPEHLAKIVAFPHDPDMRRNPRSSS